MAFSLEDQPGRGLLAGNAVGDHPPFAVSSARTWQGLRYSRTFEHIARRRELSQGDRLRQGSRRSGAAFVPGAAFTCLAGTQVLHLAG